MHCLACDVYGLIFPQAGLLRIDDLCTGQPLAIYHKDQNRVLPLRDLPPRRCIALVVCQDLIQADRGKGRFASQTVPVDQITALVLQVEYINDLRCGNFVSIGKKRH